MAKGMTTLSPVFGRTPALIRLKRMVVKPNATSPSGAGLASFCALSAMCVFLPLLFPRSLRIGANDSTVPGRRKTEYPRQSDGEYGGSPTPTAPAPRKRHFSRNHGAV